MVVSSQKFLPSGKSGSLAVRPTAKLSMIRKPLVATSSDGEAQKTVLDVRNKVTSLTFIFRRKKILKKKILDRKRKLVETEKNQKREEELESKRKKGGKKDDEKLLITPPGGNIIDSLTRFAGFTLLGFIVDKYSKFFPKLIEFGKNIQPAIEIFGSFAKNLVGGTIDFIENGYKAYDKVRAGIKNIGGEGAQKTFDEFSKNLNLILNGAIMASMLIASTAPGKPGKPGRMPGGKPSTLPSNTKLSSYLGRDSQTKLIERRYGNDAARMYEARMSQGASASRARADVLKRFDKIEGPQRGLSGGTGRSSVLSRGLGKSFNRASLKVLGKTGTRIARGVFGRIPIIGGLIDFAINLAMGEDPGRAAAKAVGATVGSTLGTFIPVPFAGTILGGILGDIVGGAMYDTLVGNKIKPQARASGGQVTRGGVAKGAVSRDIKTDIKTTKKKNIKTITPQQTVVGKNAYLGEYKNSKGEMVSTYEKVYGEKGLKALIDSSRDVKKIKFMQNIWGALGGAYIDMLLGQRPDNSLASDIGSIIGAMTNERYGRKLGQELSNSLEDSANNIFRHLYAAVGENLPSTTTTTTTTTTSNQYTPRNIPTSGYKPPSAGFFNAIQYITGDTTQSANYQSDHGGTEYHEHIAFKTEADKERAKAALRAAGFEIGSELRPGDAGYHGANLAIDVPMYKPSGGGVQKGYSNDTKGEQQFSAEVRKILGLNAPVVKPAPKPAPAKPAPAKPAQQVSYNYNGLNQQTSYELAIHERNVFLYQQETFFA